MYYKTFCGFEHSFSKNTLKNVERVDTDFTR